MKKTKIGLGFLAILIIVSISVLLQPAEQVNAKESLKPGDVVPGFKLNDHSGKSHSLSDYKGKIVVLDFSSQECPWSRGADPDLKEIAEKYSKKGIVFLGIDSHRETKPGEIKKYVNKLGLPFPILKDSKNIYADKLGAAATPELYVLDGNSKLAYHGAFDDRKSPEDKGSNNYIVNALDSLLAGNKPAVAEVKAWGCSIKRVKKSGGSGHK